mmetsp:Transcript_9592/g.14870  ORF Transcript_9592/g.14870 Transcript_9592/m.14870 type:complete len:362 (+) Transcript_9592:677-1762(+)
MATAVMATRITTLVSKRMAASTSHGTMAFKNCWNRFSTSATSPPRLVSRRAWTKYKDQHLSHKEKLLREKEKKDDKPWPMSIQIIGYTCLGLGIPYSLAWLISSNPTWVEWIEDNPGIPMNSKFVEILRQHFGETETKTYQDEVVNKEPPVYILSGEYSSHLRAQQRTIEDRIKNEWEHVMVTNRQNQQIEVDLPANFKLTNEELLSKVGSEATISPGDIALSFNDNPLKGESSDSQTENLDESFVDNTIFGTTTTDKTIKPRLNPHAAEIKKITPTYSAWHMFPEEGPTAKPPKKKGTPAMEKLEYELLKWQYTKEQAEKDLKDINCTRDMDELRDELKEAKQKLRQYRRKKILYAVIGK